jgi:hypothetical protein
VGLGQPSERRLRKQLGEQHPHRLIEGPPGATLGAVDEQQAPELEVPPQVAKLVVTGQRKRAVARQVQKRVPVQRRRIAKVNLRDLRADLDRGALLQLPQQPRQRIGTRHRLRRRLPPKLKLPERQPILPAKAPPHLRKQQHRHAQQRRSKPKESKRRKLHQERPSYNEFARPRLYPGCQAPSARGPLPITQVLWAQARTADGAPCGAS